MSAIHSSVRTYKGHYVVDAIGDFGRAGNKLLKPGRPKLTVRLVGGIVL
jgi:hypothetical protein